MNHRMRTSRRPRGTALIVAIILLGVVATLGFTVLATTTTNLRNARLQYQDAISFNCAESGADRALKWLRAQAMPPAGTSAVFPFGYTTTALGDGAYFVTIYPDADNPGRTLKEYNVVSLGTCGDQSQTVATVVRQSSFGKYAYFTDQEVSFTGSEIWFKTGETIDGPAHSNNRNGSNFNINWVGSTTPIFLDMVTGSGSVIDWAPATPGSSADYHKIFADGEYGFQLGVDEIPMPPSTDAQKNAAWGATSGFPSTNNVYLPVTGSTVTAGIYIRGDCTIQFSVATGGHQDITIVRGSDTFYVRVEQSLNQTLFKKNSGSWTTYSGVPNGAIYCTGDITALSGTIADNYVSGSDIVRRNAYTVATDVNGGNDITITNNLVYNTKPDKTEASDSYDNLHAATVGVLGRNVIIASGAPTNLEIDAQIVAGGENVDDGSFYVNNYDSKTPTGNLNVLGGIIQKQRGPVGTFNSSTGQSVSGYSKHYHYDPRMADNPPPFFPTTGNYDRLSWRSW